MTNLNAILAPYADLRGMNITAIVANLGMVLDAIHTKVRNSGGGHLNHTIFWTTMGPKGGDAPTGPLGTAINATFGSFDAFKAQFVAAGADVCGNGWTWRALNGAKQLQIGTMPNQDSSHMRGLTPIVGNDVWEACLLPEVSQRPRELPQSLAEHGQPGVGGAPLYHRQRLNKLYREDERGGSQETLRPAPFILPSDNC